MNNLHISYHKPHIKSPQRTQSSAFTTNEEAVPSRLRTRMTRIARIFTDPCASASSAQSVFHRIPSAFICVHLRLIFVSLSDRIQKNQFKLFSKLNKKCQAHSCLNLLKNKPQINADERRFVKLGIQHLSEVQSVFHPNTSSIIHMNGGAL